MRRIREAVLPFTWNSDDLPKTVREYRREYKGVSRILDNHAEILEAVHEDLKRLSFGGPKGREADFTSETILRALVVHALEGGSLRETVVRIAESDFLQDFLRTSEGSPNTPLPSIRSCSSCPKPSRDWMPSYRAPKKPLRIRCRLRASESHDDRESNSRNSGSDVEPRN